jgi:hypothetical protein
VFCCAHFIFCFTFWRKGRRASEEKEAAEGDFQKLKRNGKKEAEEMEQEGGKAWQEK